MIIPNEVVQRFTVVDKFGPISYWLDSALDSPYPCFSRKRSLLPIFNSEDSDVASCFRLRVPARRLPSLFSHAALASGLVPSSTSFLTRSSQAQQAPP